MSLQIRQFKQENIYVPPNFTRMHHRKTKKLRKTIFQGTVFKKKHKISVISFVTSIITFQCYTLIHVLIFCSNVIRSNEYHCNYFSHLQISIYSNLMRVQYNYPKCRPRNLIFFSK